MRVGLIHRDLHTVTRGGICTIYRELAPRLRDLGHDPTLITQQTPHPPALPGIDLVTLPRTDDLDSHRQAVTAAVNQLGLDILECSSWEAELLHHLRRPHAARVPVVVRGDLSANTMQAKKLIADERELITRADIVIAVSDFAASDLAATYGINRPQVVANGVDRGRFHRFPPGKPRTGYQVTIDQSGQVTSRRPLSELADKNELPPPWSTTGRTPSIVWVGKITPMKGWDRLQALLPRLQARACLTIVLGHSPAFCPVSITGQDDAVILQDIGDTDMAGLYNSADYLLSTSRWEGFGLAIAEALACETPVLLPAQLGTAPELLSDGGGHVYAGTDELVALLDGPPPASGRLPARFDWDTNAAQTATIYRALIETTSYRSEQPCESC